ncbi:hypothetical protein D3C87_1488830 [compost metagenome]
MAVHAADHVPAVGFETLRGVVGEPVHHVAVDRDAVVIPQRDQLVQLERAGQRAGFVADAFHQAAIAQEHIGVMVDDVVAGAVEFLAQQALGQRHAHRVGDALAQRAGGGFHARRDAVLGVAGGLAVQLAEVAQFLDRQVVAGQVQQRVDQHRTVAVGQHEAVAVGPVRVRGVMLQVPAPERHGDIRHAHRCTGVTGIGLLDGVHGKHADGVSHQFGGLRGERAGGGMGEGRHAART